MNTPSKSAYMCKLALDVCQQRRRMGQNSLRAFAEIYLGQHFYQPSSSMHKELFAMLQEATAKRDAHIASAAPRGHAKSTIVSMAYVLWSALYDRERFILLLASTRDQAVSLLKPLKDQIVHNGLILSDFPEAAGRGPTPWRDNQITLRNGVKISAYGAGQRLRGTKHGHHRPSLIVADDIEDWEQVRSAEQREKIQDWFFGTLLKAGDVRVNVVVVGTLLHYDSLLAKLLDSSKLPGWRGRKYQAVERPSESPLWDEWVDIFTGRSEYNGHPGQQGAEAFFKANTKKMLKGTKVLWPERESYYDLMVLREREGYRSFNTEKQNEPVDPERCLFREEDFRYWDDEYSTEEELLAATDGHRRIYGACDPSLGKAGRSRDPSAILTVLVDIKNKVYYVLDADIRKRTPDKIICDIIEYHQRRKYSKFYMETNQFQELLATELIKRSREAGTSVPVISIKNNTDKLGRIESMEPKIHNGEIRFSHRHRTLLEQLRQFPQGAHDDGPDALEMIVRHPLRPRIEYIGYELPYGVAAEAIEVWD